MFKAIKSAMLTFLQKLQLLPFHCDSSPLLLLRTQLHQWHNFWQLVFKDQVTYIHISPVWSLPINYNPTSTPSVSQI